ncbi:redoxin domain-containing protein [Candidatus Acetothermia bacterium]|nr:redoxin domain-containing protein [Candidatus Acetothermia bacterium]
MSIKRLVTSVAMAGSVLLIGWFLQPTEVAYAQPAACQAPQVGCVAPDFKAQSLDGKEIQLSALRGQPVFLSFWFTGCPVCQKEVKNWQDFDEGYGDAVKVLGVNVADDAQTVRRFVSQQGLTFNILLDPKGDFLLKYRVAKMPTMFFIDAQGIIRQISTVGLTGEGIAEVFAEKVFQAALIPVSHLTVTQQVTKGQAKGELIDVDGDGRPEGARIDLNGDGTLEATLAFWKGHVRGTIPSKKALSVQTLVGPPAKMQIALDLNNDGKPEVLIEARASDGMVERIVLDLDSDGQPELIYSKP